MRERALRSAPSLGELLSTPILMTEPNTPLHVTAPKGAAEAKEWLVGFLEKALAQSRLLQGHCPLCRTRLIPSPATPEAVEDHILAASWVCPSLWFCPNSACGTLVHFPHTRAS